MSNCKYKEEITCPYCESELGDSWECSDEGEHECYECGKKYHYSRQTSCHYDSYCADDLHEYVHTPSEKYPDIYECKNCEDMQFRNSIVARLKEYKERLSDYPEGNKYLEKAIKRDEAILKQLT